MIGNKADFEKRAKSPEGIELPLVPVSATKAAISSKYTKDKDREAWINALVELGHNRYDIEAELALRDSPHNPQLPRD